MSSDCQSNPFIDTVKKALDARRYNQRLGGGTSIRTTKNTKDYYTQNLTITLSKIYTGFNVYTGFWRNHAVSGSTVGGNY